MMFLEVLRLMKTANSVPEISETLGISPESVQIILENLKRGGYIESAEERTKDCDAEKSGCAGCALKSFCADKKLGLKIWRLTPKGMKAV